MEGRSLLQGQGKGKQKWVDRRRHITEEAGPSTSRSCSCPKGKEDPTCCYKAAEFGCSACLFCVSCPLCIAWCCIKLPCKIGLKAAGRAKHWICCGSEKKVFAEYSSFSDIDSDIASGRVGECRRCNVRANESQCKRITKANRSFK
ncbi:hypothetical protein Tsubulata_023963 [Turnera subulata]|uniref:Uncharacterized protein n=1 Tax=Turnera subulata TaxID=218843 RepID=A0A9Q0F9Z6_9ROSI|nr:hypothetical protein Tsubulata_023963 [Turnera subulata]